MHVDRLLRLGSLAAAAAVASSLVACASEPDPGAGSVAPTMAPEQTIAEACEISRDQVDQLVAEARAEIEATANDAGASLQAGRLPDLSGIGSLAETIGGSIDSVRAGVSNEEVGDALDALGAEIDDVGEIDLPANLLAVPGYLAALSTELVQVLAAGGEVQELCGSE